MGVIGAIAKGFSEAKNLCKLVMIFLGFNFVMGLVMLPFTPADPTTAVPSVAPLFISLVSVFLFIFVQAGALGVIKKQLKTNSWEMSDFIETGKKFYLRILGLFLVIIALAIVIILAVSLLSALAFAIGNTGFTRALVAALVTIISIVAAVVLLFPIYAIVAEDIGPVVAVKKSFKCAMSNFWPILGLLLILFIVTFVIYFLIGLITALLAGFLPILIGQIVTLLVNSALQGALSVIMMTVLMVYYMSITGSCSCDCQSGKQEIIPPANDETNSTEEEEKGFTPPPSE